ncbi:MAG: HugZ family protein [Rhizobiaceae bacterium]
MAEAKKDVLRETDAEAILLAKTLIRSARYGAIAVLEPGAGAPLASRVAVATDVDGAPLILVSSLSAHTAAMVGDPRCSLLLGEPGKGDPLAHPRISIACDARRLEPGGPDHARARRRYLNRQPKAKLYVDFPDFTFFRLEPSRASLNGGFGKAYALERRHLLTASAANDGLSSGEQRAVDHMNEDHRDAIAVYARAYAGAPDGDWSMTGADADGIDIACGDDVRRIFFQEPLNDPAGLRVVLVDMAREGRARLGGG